MKRYAIINSENIVDNVILWDEASQWSPPEGMTMVKVEGISCDLNWKYENGVFVDPTAEAPVAEAPTE
jgi:hypothetical protein